jgi:hypothetical protein
MGPASKASTMTVVMFVRIRFLLGGLASFMSASKVMLIDEQIKSFALNRSCKNSIQSSIP